MKKLTIILGVIASALVLASCAHTNNQETAAQTTVAHHDYKGEMK